MNLLGFRARLHDSRVSPCALCWASSLNGSRLSSFEPPQLKGWSLWTPGWIESPLVWAFIAPGWATNFNDSRVSLNSSGMGRHSSKAKRKPSLLHGKSTQHQGEPHQLQGESWRLQCESSRGYSSILLGSILLQALKSKIIVLLTNVYRK